MVCGQVFRNHLYLKNLECDSIYRQPQIQLRILVKIKTQREDVSDLKTQ